MTETDNWLLAAVFNPADLNGLDETDMVLGASYANVLATRTQLALALEHQHRDGDAESIHCQVLAIREMLLGPDHPHTLASAGHLALTLSKLRKYKEAEAIWRQTLDGMERTTGWRNPKTAATANNLAMVLSLQRKFDEAETLFRRIIDCCEIDLGPNCSTSQLVVRNLESMLRGQALGEETVLPTQFIGQTPPDSEQRKAEKKQFVERSFEKSLQESATVMETLTLIQCTRSSAPLLASSRNRIEIGHPGLDDLLGLEELQLFYPICSICMSVNPWWRETAGGFSQRIVAGIPEFVRRVHASAIARSASENGCFHCQILSTGLKQYSQQYYSSDDGWMDRDVKIVIKGTPSNATLFIGARKRERVQFFALPGMSAHGPRSYYIAFTAS
jgi:tetratricopeptide (TPR) repeat protein